MNMQQMMMQAQKTQRELQKLKDELAHKEFTVSKSGAVTVTLMGDRTVKSVNVDSDAFDADNKEMVEELIALAINEALAQINLAEEQINSKVTGGMGGLF